MYKRQVFNPDVDDDEPKRSEKNINCWKEHVSLYSNIGGQRTSSVQYLLTSSCICFDNVSVVRHMYCTFHCCLLTTVCCSCICLVHFTCQITYIQTDVNWRTHKDINGQQHLYTSTYSGASIIILCPPHSVIPAHTCSYFTIRIFRIHVYLCTSRFR